VAGEIEERGALLGFNTKDNQKFFNSLPIIFVYRFQNEGNDRVRPEGEIGIRNILGMTTTILNANPAEGNVLPGSIRRFTVEWAKEGEALEYPAEQGFFAELKRERANFALGRYTAELNLEFGVTGEKAQANFSFWVLPWRVMTLTFLIGIIVIFFLIIGIKRYNRWIIARAKSQM